MNRVALVALGSLVSTAHAAPMPSPAPSVPQPSLQASATQGMADGLIARLRKSETVLASAKAASARVKEIKDLKQYVELAIQKLPPSNPDDETRKLRTSLWTFKDYLDPIDPTQPGHSACERQRGAILAKVTPVGGAPDFVPGETLEALKILSIMCQMPELAKTPEKESSPESPDEGAGADVGVGTSTSN